MAEPRATPAAATDATRVRRHPERARRDRATVDEVLDEAPICHVGFVSNGRPVVIPTIHARSGDVVYLHGSTASRMLTTLADGVDVCVTVSIVDGLVLARSAFSSSMNYRSVMVFGRAVLVTDDEERQRAFAAIVEHVQPGRWEDCRHPTAKESAATAILRLPIDEYSAKVRSGPPQEPSTDRDLPLWAGVVPLRLTRGHPQDAPDLPAGRRLPAYLDGVTP